MDDCLRSLPVTRRTIMKTMLPIMVLVSSLVGSASAIEPIPSLANPGIKRIPMGMNRPSVNSYP